MGDLRAMLDRRDLASRLLPWLGLSLVAALSLTPLLVERGSADWVAPYASGAGAWAGKGAVLLAMLAAVAVRAWADGATERRPLPLPLLFAGLAGLMTACHWWGLDRLPWLGEWQRGMYHDILNHTASVPHQFRALPYGFVRSLEWVTGDWLFSCLTYRWFFTFWFLWACYRFARQWYGPAWSLVALAPVVILYPVSIKYYWGQLTDPLSHALFVLALVYAVQDRWRALAVALALGVLAKETAVLLVPSYAACWWRRGRWAFLKAGVLGLACLAAFLAARLPFGWWPGYENINGTDRLMVWDNLGLADESSPYQPLAPTWESGLHLAAFVGAFLPLIALGWRRADPRLKALCLTLVPLLLLSNLCFGWLYESRNYMPLVPLLATTALAGVVPEAAATPNPRAQPFSI
jgi:hypothetical protein